MSLPWERLPVYRLTWRKHGHRRVYHVDRRCFTLRLGERLRSPRRPTNPVRTLSVHDARATGFTACGRCSKVARALGDAHFNPFHRHAEER